jgi:hypothetical protein
MHVISRTSSSPQHGRAEIRKAVGVCEAPCSRRPSSASRPRSGFADVGDELTIRALTLLGHHVCFKDNHSAGCPRWLCLLESRRGARGLGCWSCVIW